MTDLAEFLLARIAEDKAVALELVEWLDSSTFPTYPWGLGDDEVTYCERFAPARVLAECDAKRRIIETHKSWPVLVETPPEFAPPAAGLNDMTFRMTQQIAWATQEEYRKRFGEEPPTTPMLRALALPYADHPDYREEWRP